MLLPSQLNSYSASSKPFLACLCATRVRHPWFMLLSIVQGRPSLSREKSCTKYVAVHSKSLRSCHVTLLRLALIPLDGEGYSCVGRSTYRNHASTYIGFVHIILDDGWTHKHTAVRLVVLGLLLGSEESPAYNYNNERWSPVTHHVITDS